MFVYGPVQSPRLGRTLEVRPIPPGTCSYSCVFCPYGRTDHLRVGRRRFYPPAKILDEILDVARRTTLDHVRFSGSGEPTLCRDLGRLIRGVKEDAALPVAVSTNASLLYRKDVRQDLDEADVVLPLLDAGSEEVFLKLNRPHCALDFDRVLEGLACFRREFSGSVWLEIMLVGGVNDGPGALKALRRSVDLVEPEQIHILRPVLPPAEPWVRSPSSVAIAEAMRVIPGARLIDGIDEGPDVLLGHQDARLAVLSLAAHAQLRWDRAVSIEKKFRAPGIVRRMIEAGDLTTADHDGVRFLLPTSIGRSRGA